jgi:hypothetical protein
MPFSLKVLFLPAPLLDPAQVYYTNIVRLLYNNRSTSVNIFLKNLQSGECLRFLAMSLYITSAMLA